MNELHPEYLDTRFRVHAPIDRWPARFAIVSAFATTGEAWSRERNERADRELEAHLHARGGWRARVLGYSPRTRHAEPSWAAELTLPQARELGRRFQQDAIYWIDDDELWVSHCEDDADPARVARFFSRLDLEQNPG